MLYRLACMLAYWSCPLIACWVLWELRWKVESNPARMALFFGVTWALCGLLAWLGLPYPFSSY